MGLFTKLFGRKIVIGVAGELVDGRTFTGSYPADVCGASEEEIRTALINKIQVDNGWQIKTFRFTGYYDR